MANNEKPASNVLPAIDPFNRYIMNGDEFGLTVPVRVHDTLTPEIAASIIKSPGFSQYMARALANRQALAIPANRKPMAIPYPSNLLGQRAGNGNGQTFELSLLASQIQGIVQMYGADMGAVKKPLKNAKISDARTEGTSSVIAITLANGKKINLTISEVIEEKPSK